MSGNFRFTWLRPGGWTRLGIVGAVMVLFGTPMLWAVGMFGDGDDALGRAAVFLLAGLWLFGAGGYAVGWAIRGFIVRQKDPEEEEDRDAPPARPGAPPHRPGH
ncbi:MAG TPA: hypothetical protein VLL76_12500 [Candidatus Omnitrophota bacterium]|nr:hypothetical protein [Candidatus Omnitrophota bacterium]